MTAVPRQWVRAMGLKIELNRYDGRSASAGLRREDVRIGGEEGAIDLTLPVGHELTVYFPVPLEGDVERWMGSIRSVLDGLAEMDNAAQRASAEACARSGLHPRNYESYIFYLRLTAPERVAIRYAGAVVNTEWDERFVRVDGAWHLSGTG